MEGLLSTGPTPSSLGTMKDAYHCLVELSIHGICQKLYTDKSFHARFYPNIERELCLI